MRGNARADEKSRFDDGAAYERMMGTWSRLTGEAFLDWLAPPPGLQWIDVGCGNGAFTELLVERCVPAETHGVDQSAAQLAFARERPVARVAQFHDGDAVALPFADDKYDAAVMALVISFVPDPAKAVAEMARVVRPGGRVAAYMWDITGGGSPLDPIDDEMRALGVLTSRTSNPGASKIESLRDLWAGAGLEAVETRAITVQRTFPDFDDFWATSVAGSVLKQALAALTPDVVERIRARVRARLPGDSAGRISYGARANAVKGRVAR